MKRDTSQDGAAVGSVITAAWYTVVVGIAIIASCVELDREGRHDPVIGAMVPGLFRADSLEGLARGSLDRDDANGAQILARQLVERRPVPAENLSLLSTALLANGQSGLAASAIQVAASRGWRDRFVQQIVIASALQNDEPDVAAQRVMALWKQGERSDWLKELTRATIAQPGGLAAFEAALSDGEQQFGADFLPWSASVLAAGAVDRLARAMARQRTPINCTRFSDEADRLVRTGKQAAAIAIWNAFCSDRRPTITDDLGFRRLEGEPGPLDWRYPESAGVETEVLKKRGSLVLRYSNSEPIFHVIARRYLVLAPARYVIEERGSTESANAQWRIACIGLDGTARDATISEVNDRSRSFVVPVNCPVQELSISARLASGQIGQVGVREVGI